MWQLIIHYTMLTCIAFYDAVMDTLTHHFGISVFKNLNPNWWNPNESFKYVKPTLGTRFDAWHIAKGLKISCMVITIVTYKPLVNMFVDVPIYFVYGGLIFELFYSYILAKKKDFKQK